MVDFDEIDQVLALELSLVKRRYHWKHADAYSNIFGLSVFGVTDTVKELVRLAKIGAQHDA